MPGKRDCNSVPTRIWGHAVPAHAGLRSDGLWVLGLRREQPKAGSCRGDRQTPNGGNKVHSTLDIQPLSANHKKIVESESFLLQTTTVGIGISD